MQQASPVPGEPQPGGVTCDVDTTAACAYLHLAVPVPQAATSSPSAALGGAGSVRVTVLACGVVGSDVVAVPQ
ncbi:MAG TPA: hypothetical protein VGL80_12075 [Pseudonocardiaceae bacterium]